MSSVLEAMLKISAIDMTGKAFGSVKAGLQSIERDARTVGMTGPTSLRAMERQAAQTSMTMGSLGRSVLALGAGYLTIDGGVRMMRALGSAAIDADRQMRALAVTSGATAAEIKTAGATLALYSTTTKTSTKDLTEAAAALVAAGQSLSTADLSAPVIAKAAKAAGAELGAMSDTAVALLQNLGATPASLERFFDIAIKGGKAGRFELKDMAGQLATVSASAQQVGLVGEEGFARLVSMLQIVREVSGSGEEAANNLRNLLDKEVAPATIKAMKKMGVDWVKAMRNAKREGKDLTETFIDLTDKVTKGDPVKISAILPDRDARQALLGLLQNTGRYHDLVRALNDSLGETGRDFARMTKGAAAGVEHLTSSWESFVRAVGTSTGPALERAAEALAKFFDRNTARQTLRDTYSDAYAKLYGKSPPLGSLIGGDLDQMALDVTRGRLTPEDAEKRAKEMGIDRGGWAAVAAGTLSADDQRAMMRGVVLDRAARAGTAKRPTPEPSPADKALRNWGNSFTVNRANGLFDPYAALPTKTDPGVYFGLNKSFALPPGGFTDPKQVADYFAPAPTPLIVDKVAADLARGLARGLTTVMGPPVPAPKPTKQAPVARNGGVTPVPLPTPRPADVEIAKSVTRLVDAATRIAPAPRPGDRALVAAARAGVLPTPKPLPQPPATIARPSAEPVAGPKRTSEPASAQDQTVRAPDAASALDDLAATGRALQALADRAVGQMVPGPLGIPAQPADIKVAPVVDRLASSVDPFGADRFSRAVTVFEAAVVALKDRSIPASLTQAAKTAPADAAYLDLSRSFAMPGRFVSDQDRRDFFTPPDLGQLPTARDVAAAFAFLPPLKVGAPNLKAPEIPPVDIRVPKIPDVMMRVPALPRLQTGDIPPVMLKAPPAPMLRIGPLPPLPRLQVETPKVPDLRVGKVPDIRVALGEVPDPIKVDLPPGLSEMAATMGRLLAGEAERAAATIRAAVPPAAGRGAEAPLSAGWADAFLGTFQALAGLAKSPTTSASDAKVANAAAAQMPPTSKTDDTVATLLSSSVTRLADAAASLGAFSRDTKLWDGRPQPPASMREPEPGRFTLPRMKTTPMGEDPSPSGFVSPFRQKDKSSDVGASVVNALRDGPIVAEVKGPVTAELKGSADLHIAVDVTGAGRVTSVSSSTTGNLRTSVGVTMSDVEQAAGGGGIGHM